MKLRRSAVHGFHESQVDNTRACVCIVNNYCSCSARDLEFFAAFLLLKDAQWFKFQIPLLLLDASSPITVEVHSAVLRPLAGSSRKPLPLWNASLCPQLDRPSHGGAGQCRFC